MATHIDAFAINGTKIALSDDNYTEKRGFAAYTNQTEAGTTRRDVIRIGYLAELTVKIRTVGTVKATFDQSAALDSITLKLWQDNGSKAKNWDCYIADYTADLVRDTDSATYWDISATFRDLGES